MNTIYKNAVFRRDGDTILFEYKGSPKEEKSMDTECTCSVCELKETVENLRDRLCKVEGRVKVNREGSSSTNWTSTTSTWMGTSSRAYVGEAIVAIMEHLKLNFEFPDDQHVKVIKKKKTKNK